jgi:hypothetical protein
MATGTATRRMARAPRRAAQQQRENPPALEADAVEIEVEELTAFNPSKNLMIYGPSGHGKTVLAGGTPNAVFLSTEGGVVSAKRTGSTARLIRAPDWEHALSGVKWADDNLGKEDWLIVDSHTRLQLEYVRWLLRMKNLENSARDLDIPALQDHQKWQNAFMRWTDHIISAPYNSIFICAEMRRENEEGDLEVLPQIRGGKNLEVCRYISSQMDVALYYAISDRATEANEDGLIIRRALAQPYPPYFAKDRYKALGRFIDVEDEYYETMLDIIDMIDNSMQEES